MRQLSYKDAVYRTGSVAVSPFAGTFPELSFYARFFGIVYKASVNAKHDRYDDDEWCQSSFDVLRTLESVGLNFEVTGIDNMKQLDTPCVVISNHMSVLETVILPVILLPVLKITYIIKQSLLEYPVFKHIMRSRDPIAVGRTNPRLDLKAVLEGGSERLKKGISIIVFPQTTRKLSIDPAQFNTIGIKLAQKANVPIVPLALKTDAWGNGKHIKDFGKIDPSKKVRFSFGESMLIQGRGREEHQAVIQFISGKLREWKDEVGS